MRREPALDTGSRINRVGFNETTIKEKIMSKANHTSLVALLTLLAACGGGAGTTLGPQPPPPSGDPPPSGGPPAVQTQQVFDQINLSLPLVLAQAPNDASRFFAAERAGRVSVFGSDPATAARATFLDISARVNASGEGGLLGLAFHPEFATNGEVYVSYTRTGSPLESVISRFRSLDGNQTLDPASEEILLTVLQPFSNHNGGDLAFGPDGLLYAGFGDGGSGGDPQGNGQDPTNLLGTIIRIDVNVAQGYTIPPTNPFAQNAPCGLQGGFGGGSCPEIYAWGFRNPWRFSFDRQAGALWVGDVGQGSWEEVDRVDPGENYGWNVREGAHCFSPSSGCGTNFVDPITEYDHSVGNSITGGYVYRGSALPDLQGFYLFGDFGSGRIWAVPADSPIGTAPVEIANTNHQIASFAEANDGELYILDFASGGSLHRIVAP